MRVQEAVDPFLDIGVTLRRCDAVGNIRAINYTTRTVDMTP